MDKTEKLAPIKKRERKTYSISPLTRELLALARKETGEYTGRLLDAAVLKMYGPLKKKYDKSGKCL